MAALSDLADRSLERAVAAAIAERTPDAEPRGFAIIALGKHGSRELNYSSDVDLLFLFDPATPAAEAARGAGPGGGPRSASASSSCSRSATATAMSSGSTSGFARRRK